MSSPVFLTVGIVGGLMVLGGLTYIAIGKSKILEKKDHEYEKYRKKYQEKEDYTKNVHDRATLLRNRKMNRTYRRPARYTERTLFSGGSKKNFK